MGGKYDVGKDGSVRGAGELVEFDRTGNTYGMEVWVDVGTSNKTTERFVRPFVAPYAANP